MGTYVVKLPDVGEGIAEAEIVEWHVEVGGVVSEDQPMVDVMTDKATVELPAPVTGTVAWIGAQVGDVLAVGSELIRIETADGAPSSPPATPTRPEIADVASSPPPPPPPSPSPSPAPPSPAPPSPAPPSPTALAAPAVRRRARDLGVDLATVVGTGPDGRVEHGDLDRHLLRGHRPAAGPPTTPGSTDALEDGGVEDVRVLGLRRNIARRMQESKRRIPHFTYVEAIDVTEVERLRAELNRGGAESAVKLTLLPFLMRAVVVALRDHPEMNARFDDEAGVVHRHRAVNLGIAVQTPKGLMVPVVHDAHALDLATSAAEVARLSDAARNGTIGLAELNGSTITITSLGALGGIVSTPVINHPEVAIVGVNKIETRPEHRHGVWVPRQVMNLSSSFDHRVIDGWDAARFVQRIKAVLETPGLLFVTSTT